MPNNINNKKNKKNKKKKLHGKLAVGIFVDGLNIKVACLLKQNGTIRVVDAQNIPLAGPIEVAGTDEDLLGEDIDFSTEDSNMPIEITDLDSETSEIKIDEQGNVSKKPDEDDSQMMQDFSISEETSPHEDDSENEFDLSSGKNESSEAMPIDLEFLLDAPEEEESSESFDDDINSLQIMSDIDEPADNTEPEEVDQSAIDVSTLDLTEDLNNIDLMDSTVSSEDDTNPVDLTEGIKDNSLEKTRTSVKQDDNTSILMSILDRYPERKFELAISLPEPQVYYSYFDSDWGLKGKNLKKHISEELFKEKTDSVPIELDAIHAFHLADENLMAIVRDAEIGIFNLLEAVNVGYEKRLPKISLVESSEISLVNLVKKNYSFAEDEISVIVFVGNDFSRLIFMKGNELYHISPIIGEGIESFLVFGHSLTELGNTIHSRLLLEQDDLHLPTVHRLILTGDACRAEIKNILQSWFTDEIEIKEIQYNSIITKSVNSAVKKNLHQVPIAIGAALRALDTNNDEYYKVDLLPRKIRDEQKIFRLGAPGWFCLCLIPVLTLYMTHKINQLSANLDILQVKEQQKSSELAGLQQIQIKVDEIANKLNYYQNTFGVLDSMVVGTQTWSGFLKKVVIEARKLGGIWITDINASSDYKAKILGYSLNRTKIPGFSNSLGNATLNQVQVQEIRNQRVYYFEITVNVPLENE